MEYLILNSKSDPIETARAYVVLPHYLALFQMRNNMNQESLIMVTAINCQSGDY